VTDRRGQIELAKTDNGRRPRTKGCHAASDAFYRRDGIAAWPRMLTVDLVAAYIGLAPQTVRNNVDRIPGRRNLGRRVLFDRQVIDQWLDRGDSARDLWVDSRAMTE